MRVLLDGTSFIKGKYIVGVDVSPMINIPATSELFGRVNIHPIPCVVIRLKVFLSVKK